MRRSLFTALLLHVFAMTSALAGPPLISDDPHTQGPGRLELNLAVSGFGHPESADLLAPQLDVTLGVFEGVDLIADVAPVFTFSKDLPTETAVAASLGVKWQPLRGEHWNLAFTPTASFGMPLIADSTVALPIQLEFSWKSLFVGSDGGYVFAFEDADLWFATLYAGWALADRLVVLGEIWGGRSVLDQEEEVGVTVGLDWTLPWGAHLLVAGGPGIAPSRTRRIRWRVYTGVQWNFTLWTPD